LPVWDPAEALVAGVAVTPGEAAADHAGLLAVGGVVGAVEGEVAQRGELGLDPVQPARIGRGVGKLYVVGCGPDADPGVVVGAQVRAEGVQHDPDAHPWRVEGAQEDQELPPTLARPDMARQPVV
jgi:hypothetical protein